MERFIYLKFMVFLLLILRILFRKFPSGYIGEIDMKKVLYGLGIFIAVWIVMLISLTVIFHKTYRFELIIKNKIEALLPAGSDINLGKIRGNVLNTISIDSFALNLSDGISVKTAKIYVEYNLFSLLSGKPRIKKIEINDPQIIMVIDDSTESDINSENFVFNPDSISIPFEKVFPDSLNLQIKEGLANLPEIYLEQLKVNNLHIVKNQEEIFTNGFIELSLQPGVMDVRKISGIIGGKIPVSDLNFYCSYDGSSLLINRFSLDSDNGIFKGKLDIDFDKDINGLFIIDTLGVNEKFLKQLFPYSKKLFKSVKLSSTGYVYFYPDSVYFNVAPEGYFNEVAIDSSVIKGKLGKSSLQIDTLKVWSSDGIVDGKMITAFGLKTWMELNLHNFKINKASALIDSSEINLNFKINFDKWDITRLSGKLIVNLNRSYVNEIGVEKVFLSVNAENGTYIIDSTSGAYFTNNAIFNLSGEFNGRMKGQVNLAFKDADFHELGIMVGIKELKGCGDGFFRFYGNLSDPNLYSELLLDSLGYEKYIGYGIEEKIDIKKVLSERNGKYNLEIFSADLDGYMLTDAFCNLNIYENKIRIDSLTFISDENLLDIKGLINAGRDSIGVYLSRLSADYMGIKVFNPDTIVLSFKNQEINFTDFVLNTNYGGKVVFSGKLNLGENESDFAFSLKNMNMGLLNQFNMVPYRLGGDIDFQGTFTNSFAHPNIAFDGVLDRMVAMGKLILDGNYINSYLSVNKFNWQKDSSYFNVEGAMDIDSFLNEPNISSKNYIKMKLKDFDFYWIKKITDLNFPFQGKINSELILKNTLANISGEGTISLSQFRFREFGFDSVFASLSINNGELALNDGMLNVQGTQFLFYAETFLHYSLQDKTVSFLNEPLSAFISASAKNLKFLGDINEEVQNIRGNIQVDLEIGGTVSDPVIKAGNLDVTDGKLYLYKLANSIKIKQLSAVFEDGKMFLHIPEAYASSRDIEKSLIDRFWGSISSLLTFWKKNKDDGLIEINGIVDLKDLSHPELDLSINLHKAYINYFVENVEVIVTSDNLKIEGTDTLLITGDVQIDEGYYKVDLTKYEKNLLLETGERESPPYLWLNLNVDIPGNFYATQDDPLNSFDFQIMGALRVIKEPRQLMEISGIMEILEGGLMLYGKKIEVVTGKISFVNPKDLPDIELLAELRQPPFYFEISERGNIANPELDIKLYPLEGGDELPYDIKDKISILLTGVPFADMNTADLKATGVQAVTASVLNLMQSKAKKYTGLDKIQIGNEENIMSSQLNAGLEDMSYYSLGKYLSNNIYIEYKTGMSGGGSMGIGAPKISWAPGNEIQLNYRLNKNWSFGTNYSMTLSGNEKIKFDLSWKIKF